MTVIQACTPAAVLGLSWSWHCRSRDLTLGPFSGPDHSFCFVLFFASILLLWYCMSPSVTVLSHCNCCSRKVGGADHAASGTQLSRARLRGVTTCSTSHCRWVTLTCVGVKPTHKVPRHILCILNESSCSSGEGLYKKNYKPRSFMCTVYKCKKITIP